MLLERIPLHQGHLSVQLVLLGHFMLLLGLQHVALFFHVYLVHILLQ